MGLPDLSFLVPHLPHGYSGWDAMTTLVYIGFFKIMRGVVMKHRAAFVDRMGWSFICWDVGVGAAFVLASVWAFYPALRFHLIGPIAINLMLKLLTTWQVYEIVRQPQTRVEAAASGMIVANGNGDFSGEDRREYQRRMDDRTRDDLLAKMEHA